MDYYGCPKENLIQVTGATFPIEEHYANYDIPNYIKYAVSNTLELRVKSFLY